MTIYQQRVAKLQRELPRLAWSVAEVSAQLGLPYDTVLAAIHAGEIQAIKIGRHHRIPDSELTRLVGAESRQTATAPAAPNEKWGPALHTPTPR